MGISVEQWRASIGRWARGGVVSSKVNSAVTSPQFYFFLVLLVLLVIGGVEMNPGPVQGSQQVKYRKTPGAADMAGELYECKLAALLFLRCINSEHEFHIASNMAAAVCYDDVVLTLGQRSAFLQLKHKQQKNTKIYTSQLFTVKGDFSLIRCWKSFLDIKQRWAAEEDLQRCGQFNDCLFVMYTNASLVGSGDSNVGSNEMLDLVNTGGKLIQFTEIQHPDIYQFFRDLPGYKQILSEAVNVDQVVESPELLQVVQKLQNKKTKFVPDKETLNELLKVLESLGDLSKYSDFLYRLRFCTAQKREGALDDLIKAEVKVLFGSDEQYDKFTHGVENWSRQRRPYLLDPNAKFFQGIIKTIAANISKHIPKLNVKFSQDACQEIREKYQNTNRKLFIKSNCIKMSVIKVLQSFDSNTLLIDISTIQKCMSEMLAVWKYGKCNVLVVEGGDISGLEDKVSTLPDSKGLVVLSDIHKSEQQFVDTFCLSQLEPDSRQQVLESQVDFQGYTVRLNSLVDESFLQTELSAEVVEQLHNTLQIGQKLQELDLCYLHRTFQRRDLLNEMIFKEEGITLAVSGTTKACLATLVPPGEKIEKFIPGSFDKNAGCRFWLVEAEAEFMALSKTVEVNVHWVEACKDGFCWKRSKGDMSSITKHRKDNPAICDDINKMIELCQQVVLIVAEPGMGKSTEMSNIAHLIKRMDACTWVVRINLNDWMSLLGQQVPALEFLQQVATLNTEFEKHLLQCELESVGNVVVILDGVDEVSHSYSHQVCHLLKELSKMKIERIFVTSRPVMLQQLENQLFTMAFSLLPFTRDEQKTFLINFWNKFSVSSPNLHKFASLLLNLVALSVNDILNELTGIPLQSRMLAEVYQDDAAHFCLTGEARLPECFDMLQLYSQFVYKKCKVYFEKNGMNLNKGMFTPLEDYQHMCQQSLMSCALVSYLHSDDITNLNNSETILMQNKQFIDGFKSGRNNIGIVVKLVNEKAVFLHRTFTEYFIALYFSENYHIQPTGVKNIYMNKDFNVIQNFLDRILAKGHELHTSVINRNLTEFVNLVLQPSTDVNERDRGGRTALYLHILNLNNCNLLYIDFYDTRYRFIETLLELGADVNCEEDKVLHYRPLRLAEEIKAWFVVDKLLGKQADDTDLVWVRENVQKQVATRQDFVQSASGHVEPTSGEVHTTGKKVESRSESDEECCMSESLQNVMASALPKGYVNLVKFILKCGVSSHHEVVGDRYRGSRTMLHAAAECGQLAIVKLFIEQGADVNNTSSMCFATPLMHAAEYGHVKVAELLVEHGASVNASDVLGRTALLLGAQKVDNKMVNFLSPLTSYDVTDIDSVICAAGCGDVEAALILAQNQCINSVDEWNDTALFLAAGLGKCEVVECLLEHGAHVNSLNNGKKTALMRAAEHGHMKVAELLVEHGASVNAGDYLNFTALSLASNEGQHEIVEFLLQHKADVNMSDQLFNMTPLLHAVINGHVKVAELLIKYGASLDTRYSRVYNAMLSASCNGQHEIVEFLLQFSPEHLLQCGADVDVCDDPNITPLMHAAERGHVKVAELLIKHGASVNTRNSHGHTALDYATIRHHDDVIELLKQHSAEK